MRTSTLLPLNLSSPLSASSAASTITSATSLCLDADQLEIVDRAAGDARRRRHARHVFRQHVRHAAAERIVDAAGAAGGDGDVESAARSADAGKQRRSGQRHVLESMNLSAFHYRISPLGLMTFASGRRRFGRPACMRCFSRTSGGDGQAKCRGVADVAADNGLDQRFQQARKHQEQPGQHQQRRVRAAWCAAAPSLAPPPRAPPRPNAVLSRDQDDVDPGAARPGSSAAGRRPRGSSTNTNGTRNAGSVYFHACSVVL